MVLPYNLKAWQRGSTSAITHVVTLRIQLTSYWPQDLRSSLTIGCRTSLVPPTRGFPNMVLVTWQLTSINAHVQEQQEGAIKVDVIVFLSPSLRSNISHFCYILFIESKSLGPVQTKVKGLQKGMYTVKQGLFGAIVRTACYSKAFPHPGEGNQFNFLIPTVSNYLQAYLKLEYWHFLFLTLCLDTTVYDGFISFKEFPRNCSWANFFSFLRPLWIFIFQNNCFHYFSVHFSILNSPMTNLCKSYLILLTFLDTQISILLLTPVIERNLGSLIRYSLYISVSLLIHYWI